MFPLSICSRFCYVSFQHLFTAQPCFFSASALAWLCHVSIQYNMFTALVYLISASALGSAMFLFSTWSRLCYVYLHDMFAAKCLFITIFLFSICSQLFYVSFQHVFTAELWLLITIFLFSISSDFTALQ